MVRNVALASFVCGCVLIALRASTAAACGGNSCYPDQFVPRDGTVPANIPGIAWWDGVDYNPPDQDAGGPSKVVTTPDDLAFECTPQGGAPRVVEFDAAAMTQTAPYSHLKPKAALVEGEQCSLKSKVVPCDVREGADYLLSLPHDLEFLSGVANFRVGPAAPLPATLGRFVTEPAAIEKVELSEGSGCNNIDEVCAVRGAIEFSDDARAWKDVFVFETQVDGKRWTMPLSAPLPTEAGGSYLGRGKELVFARKPGVPRATDVMGTSVGRHTIVLRASLPGTDIQFETAPVEIDLDCYPKKPSSVDADVDAATPTETEPDGSIAGDAGEAGPRDAGDSGNPSKPRRRSQRDSSCSATPAESTGRSAGACALFALFALAFVVRRRDRYRA